MVAVDTRWAHVLSSIIKMTQPGSYKYNEKAVAKFEI